MQVAINALKKMNVDLKVVCDFDILNSENTLKQIQKAIWDIEVETKIKIKLMDKLEFMR